MQESVLRVLALVGRRQRAALALRSMAYGLLAGSLLGLTFGVVRWRWGVPLPLWGMAASGPLVALLAVLFALLRRGGLHDAAAAVDRHYQFKDRSATALEFLGKVSPTPLQALQIADAAQHLQRVDPRDVAPLKRPRSLLVALGSWALAAGAALLLWLVPFGEPAVEAGPAPPQILAVIERLEERLQDLDEEARKEQDKELEKLVEFRRQKIEEMKQANLDQREALLKLSEMEAATQALHAQYNTALAEGQLASAGSAMCAAPALEGAGRALQENKLDKGAEELEKLEEPNLTPKEQKVVEEKLKQVAKEMGEAGLGQLSGAVSDFAESLKGGKGKGKKATKVLAREVKNVARRKRINNLLTGELDDLKECKCNCNGNSLVTGKKPQKSTSPSSSFDATTSGNVQGERTNLLGQRNQVDLTGTPGEGPSDVETTASPEARQQARRSYKEVYKKYRKESDAVLDSEAIPLGHRQTIRRYFELIRPQSGDMPEKKPASQE